MVNCVDQLDDVWVGIHSSQYYWFSDFEARNWQAFDGAVGGGWGGELASLES